MELIECLKHDIADERAKAEGGWRYLHQDQQSLSSIRLEALSKSENLGDQSNIVHVGSNGFVKAIVTAFAQHLPLTLSPDDIWVTISYAFAKHVDQNAEALRKNFVQHEGKKRLVVITPDSFQLSNVNSPDTGATPEEWETFVFPHFSEQIKEHIGTKTHEAIVPKYSTTSAAVKAANEITLMSAMKNYFSYGMMTACGIPQITLLGTEEDWISLRSRAEHLGSLMTTEFSNYWMPLLLPVLDEFINSYNGDVNHGFWQSMVKLRHTGGGSGSYSFLSGWIQLLFPYLASGDMAEKLRPWHEMYFVGPKMDDLPPLCSSAPVDWDYHGTKYDLNFHAGVLGYTQEKDTGALSPLLGWYVSHAPPPPTTTPADEATDKNKEGKY